MNKKHGLVIAMACCLWVGLASAEAVKPIKSSRADVAGGIFSRADAVKSSADGFESVDVIRYESKDAAFQTGMYKSGPMREEKQAPGMPYDEFLYFTSGGVKLTSTDGSVIDVNAGESVTIPKGWTGVFETAGYEKMYVIYDAAAVKP